MQLNIDVSVPSPEELERQLLRGVARELNRRLRPIVEPVRKRLLFSIEQAFVSSPEFQSLIGGRLQAELGVVDSFPVLNAILGGINAGMEVFWKNLEPTIGGFSGGLNVHILRIDLSEVLNLSVGSFRSEGGHQIDWLHWLLTAGDAIVIAEYQFIPGNTRASRTGLGIMKKHGFWRVPPEFAGTVRDNWLTRTLASMDGRVETIIEEEARRVL